MSGDHNVDYQRKNQQVKEREDRLINRNLLQQQQESIQRKEHRWSWIKPWLQACASILAYPIYERRAILHLYLPLKKLPRALAGDSARCKAPLSRSASSRSLDSIGLQNSGEEIQNNIERVPQPVPMAGAVPTVPITIQLGVVSDRTTNVASLPTFSGWQGSDLDHHLSQFLTACVANNARTEDVWLRWLPATLKDIAFEWYNRQPIGQFPNWEALKNAFFTHF